MNTLDEPTAGMKSNNKFIQFTSETPSDYAHDDEDIPTLDFKISVNNDGEYNLKFF